MLAREALKQHNSQVLSWRTDVQRNGLFTTQSWSIARDTSCLPSATDDTNGNDLTFNETGQGGEENRLPPVPKLDSEGETMQMAANKAGRPCLLLSSTSSTALT
jgi:hypothetical protein